MVKYLGILFMLTGITNSVWYGIKFMGETDVVMSGSSVFYMMIGVAMMVAGWMIISDLGEVEGNKK